MALLSLSLFFFSFAYQMRPRAKRGGLTRTNLDTDDYLVGRVTHGRTRGHPSEALRQLRVDSLGRVPQGAIRTPSCDFRVLALKCLHYVLALSFTKSC